MTTSTLKDKNSDTPEVSMKRVVLNNEKYYKISNNDFMRPFFMSIVSDSNHWMFIASNGGLTAGRKNPDYSLFPYYTDDKVTETFETTGSKTIFSVVKNDSRHVWEPFSIRSDGFYETTRNLYKGVYGNKILFEEINHDLGLTFRYQWSSSNLYGFVRQSWIINDDEDAVDLSLIDGIQNVLPAGVGADLQNQSSNLVDAYKRNELVSEVNMGLFALSAIIVDKAEPSEALRTNVVWSNGLNNPTVLLSTLQLTRFRKNQPIEQETDIKAEKGAFFVNTSFTLNPNEKRDWTIVADVNKDHIAIAELIHFIKNEKDVYASLQEDIHLGTQRLIKLNASSDGIQLSSDKFRDARHFSNSLFNIMRGGVFDNNYVIEKWDILNYLKNVNINVFNRSKALFNQLSEEFTLFELQAITHKNTDANLRRLCDEYLPLKFSRRHGDPSRPWNKFSINTRSEIDGSKILDYEGNWRDIFQNWEALALSFPAFTEAMINKFLNATTFEGYNPYRVTKDGFDWETIEPDNPWSYIGYWGDHQIIYLLKLLEIQEKYYPGKLKQLFHDQSFVYANVPYIIKDYEAILENPKDTILFNDELDLDIRKRRKEVGADAALLYDENNEIYKVNFIEKILATVLSKVSNFIPEAGIWMNTQRPEWNDANNALVGNGVSMVTLYYLRRFMVFFRKLINETEQERVELSNELIIFYKRVRSALEDYHPLLENSINDRERKAILDKLGYAASDYRDHIYKQGFWGKKRTASYNGLRRFADLTLDFIDHTIKENQREDKLYHAYNLMTVGDNDDISISYLSEMLEGQVAVLSSGYLTPEAALDVLDGLKKSALFREDQYSYILYPNKDLPGFLQRNTIPKKLVENNPLLSQLIATGDHRIINKDINGVYHFNGLFKNANDLKTALNALEGTEWEELAKKEYKKVLGIFETVFNHKAFTGRSGTFFGYEGLGSIYWHMVSKLQLAVQEVCIEAVRSKADASTIGRLLEHYYEINEGIGAHKPPILYGAFSTDPYSHTPSGKGAQQPGMTGQVKEDVLCRFGELGVFVNDGKVCFEPFLLRKTEFTVSPRVFRYYTIYGEYVEEDVEIGSIYFTCCQVPVRYFIGSTNQINIEKTNGETITVSRFCLNEEQSSSLFSRDGSIKKISVQIEPSILK
jgi:hypothetical protein